VERGFIDMKGLAKENKNDSPIDSQVSNIQPNRA